MFDLLALVAGFAVGALAVVGINGARRGSRPVPVVGAPAARSHPGPPAPRPAAPGPSSPADHGIRVNQPAARPAAPPRSAPPSAADATAVAAGPSLGKRAGTARPRLALEDGSDAVDLVDQPVTLGRGADQRLRINDTRASRAHAVVRRRSRGREGWEVEDQGSANGTELNGHRIPDGRVAPLRDGDRIGIGGTVVVYSDRGGAPPPSGASSGPEATRVAR